MDNKQKIRVYSDLHNEFEIYSVPVMENESEQVIVLAGDIGLLKASNVDPTMFDFIDELSERFKNVIFVSGNHEYYGSEYHKANTMLKTGMYPNNYERHGWNDNVHFLLDDHVVIDDIAFIGATLWTDFDRGNPITMYDGKSMMNDYHKITIKDKGVYRKLDPKDALSIHMKSRDYIFGMVDHFRKDGKKTVVITHHLPSFESVAECYSGSSLNGCYASDLDSDIGIHRPDVWIHGHTHISYDYNIYDTRIVCNPRGYCQANNNGVKKSENSGFDEFKLIEI